MGLQRVIAKNIVEARDYINQLTQEKRAGVVGIYRGNVFAIGWKANFYELSDLPLIYIASWRYYGEDGAKDVCTLLGIDFSDR